MPREPGARSASASTSTSRKASRTTVAPRPSPRRSRRGPSTRSAPARVRRRPASRTSTDDISSGRRGGLRSHRGPGGRTRDQLYEEAKHKNIKGRSKMTKAQLERAVDR